MPAPSTVKATRISITFTKTQLTKSTPAKSLKPELAVLGPELGKRIVVTCLNPCARSYHPSELPGTSLTPPVDVRAATTATLPNLQNSITASSLAVPKLPVASSLASECYYSVNRPPECMSSERLKHDHPFHNSNPPTTNRPSHNSDGHNKLDQLIRDATINFKASTSWEDFFDQQHDPCRDWGEVGN